MTEYEMIDLICDNVNPTLLLLTIGLIVKDFIKKVFHRAIQTTLVLVVGIVLVYGTLFIDNAFQLWPMIGADYSTHTAAAVTLCLALYTNTGRFIIWFLILGLYIAAMLYQEYHTVLDISSTALFIGIPLLILKNFISKPNNGT